MNGLQGAVQRAVNPWLWHCHPAVDVDRLPGDVPGFAARKVDTRRANVLAAAHRAEGYARQNALALLLIQRIGHCRGHEPRRNRVDRDASTGELLCDGL